MTHYLVFTKIVITTFGGLAVNKQKLHTPELLFSLYVYDESCWLLCSGCRPTRSKIV